ncbi:DUF726-domain-containing protein [Crassisporium funariophilum]|nr:DUF726-domain-containing protein [Crassisporium funariophilum]
MATDLEKITPPKDLSEKDKAIVFQHFFCRLASYRNTAVLYAAIEHSLSDSNEWQREAFEEEINIWAQSLLEKAWIVCHATETENCPKLDPLADTAMINIEILPPADELEKILNTILFLDITTSKQYSARTRTFLSTLGTLDETTIVSILKHPEHAIEEAQKQTEATRTDHAERGKTLRVMGMGLGAIAGGVLVGVTGGLAAPLVGAGVATFLGFFGIGGSLLGILAGGLAGSSVVCGTLFGVYGANSTANMVERHTKEVSDLAVLPIRNTKKGYDSLGTRLCVSGWLSSKEDIIAPWTIFNGDDTFALQWETKALEELSTALMVLIKSQAMQYVKGEIIKRTIFAALMNSLAPLALLNVGQIIDNPWMNAKALAIKTGAVLGELLENRVFGNRPVTLVGYSLGSLVIFEAIKYLASLEPSKTIHLIQDVYLFGTPTPADPSDWTSARRVVSGRLVNGYSSNDYVLAVLSRASDASWKVAGMQEVDVKGVENVRCEAVEGHTMWRGMIGKCLENCGAPGIIKEEVQLQVQTQCTQGLPREVEKH